jgi:hypothetical protein
VFPGPQEAAFLAQFEARPKKKQDKGKSPPVVPLLKSRRMLPVPGNSNIMMTSRLQHRSSGNQLQAGGRLRSAVHDDGKIDCRRQIVSRNNTFCGTASARQPTFWREKGPPQKLRKSCQP